MTNTRATPRTLLAAEDAPERRPEGTWRNSPTGYWLAMSQANVEIVRRGWEHFLATGELLQENVAQDFAWDMSTFRGWPEQQLYVGAEGTRAFLRDWTGAFDDWTIELQALHDGGDMVVSVCRQRGRSRTTGMPLEMLFGMVWTVRDGLQTRMEMYADPAEALKAAGLDHAV